MQLVNYTLPEFCFLDAWHQSGNLLEGRTVIQHIRSYTVVEAIALDEVLDMQVNTAYHDFKFKNCFGAVENHRLMLHFTMSEGEELPEIFKKIEAWYVSYMQWEDNNIITDNQSELN